MDLLQQGGALLGGVLAGIAALLPFSPAPERPLPGSVEADYRRIAPEMAGRVLTLAVTRGQAVAAGAPLFTLDDGGERLALAEAEARLAAAQAQHRNLLSGRRPEELAVIQAQLQEARIRLEQDRARLVRRQALAASKVLAPEGLEDAAAAVETDAARIASLEAQVAVARLPARPDEVAAAQAQIAVAEAALRQARWRLERLWVAAPTAATVDDILHWPGETVAAGAAVVTLLPPDAIKVRFYVPEPRLAGLQPGQTVALACDGCPPGLSASIAFIASEAEYTPPVIYSLGNREKLVFRVEARPDAAARLRLRPGLPVAVRLPDPARTLVP